jgi:hypothetical protein
VPGLAGRGAVLVGPVISIIAAFLRQIVRAVTAPACPYCCSKLRLVRSTHMKVNIAMMMMMMMMMRNIQTIRTYTKAS